MKTSSSFAMPLGLALGIIACAAGPQPQPLGPPPSTASAEPSAGDPNAAVSSPPVAPVEPSGETPAPGPPGMSFAVRDLGVSVPDEWRACGAPSDCTLVVTTCCDQCNRGKAVSVNTKHAKDVAAKYPKNCDKTACTERGCFTRANCIESRCVLEWQSG
ncbi:MAG: hypothetical protein IPI67_02710 [Myxococcales bacterium]|nr:hypothetical protein [Myxococcales bacterium]